MTARRSPRNAARRARARAGRAVTAGVHGVLSRHAIQRIVPPVALITGIAASSVDPVRTADEGELALRALRPDVSGLALVGGYLDGRIVLGRYGEARGVAWSALGNRGLITQQTAHVPKNARSLLSSGRFRVRTDTCFDAVVDRCRRADGTWLNVAVSAALSDLARAGLARSIEVFDSEDRLVGGNFGLDIGGWHVGMSAFSDVSGAGNAAFAYVAREISEARSIVVCDVGEMKPHLERWGARPASSAEISSRLLAHLGTLSVDARADRTSRTTKDLVT